MSLKMNPDIYKNGVIIGVMVGSTEAIEAIVKEASEKSGQPIDWHRAVGRAVVKTTGDTVAATQALHSAIPVLLGGE